MSEEKVSGPPRSFGACVVCCGANTQRGSCAKCGVSGLCEKCLTYPCPTHKQPDEETTKAQTPTEKGKRGAAKSRTVYPETPE